ncbi:MAG: GatB/YqeY domain-containing protein [Desulfovibrio sp.]|nr:GatB/YqeY domain-containing protein [Desulfovibrio sp.]
MTLDKRLSEDYIAAYKAKNAAVLSVLRLLKTAITNRQVELRKPGAPLPDEEIISLIIRQAKQRKDSIEQFRAAGRADLAEKEAQELAILEQYLPSQLTPEELDAAISQAISETGVTDPREMGKVVGAIMARYQGRVDGKAVAAGVREKLQAS